MIFLYLYKPLSVFFNRIFFHALLPYSPVLVMLIPLMQGVVQVDNSIMVNFGKIIIWVPKMKFHFRMQKQHKIISYHPNVEKKLHLWDFSLVISGNAELVKWLLTNVKKWIEITRSHLYSVKNVRFKMWYKTLLKWLSQSRSHEHSKSSDQNQSTYI